MDKPTKPTDLMPRSFGGIKNNFSASLQASGYEDGVPQIYGGDNLNYQLDATGKELDYCETICDYINALPIGKTISTDSNNKLIYTDLNFLKKNQITDCILEAPNGVATYSGNDITIKSGLKVLMPNGRNSDGTLKNIEYTVLEDIIETPSLISNKTFEIFLMNDKINNEQIIYWKTEDIYIQDSEPFTPVSGKNGLWYSPSLNVYKYSINGSAWATYTNALCKIMNVTVNSSNIISTLTSYNPINLLKRTDKVEIGGWGMPSKKYENLSFGASLSTYIMPANGWVTCGIVAWFGGAPSGYYEIALLNSTKGLNSTISANTLTGYGAQVYIPVEKGDVVQIRYLNVSPVTFSFIYAIGSESEA